MTKIKIAALQTKVYADKMENLKQLAKILSSTELRGVDFVTLGEMFNCPYQTSNFPTYAEIEGGECWRLCSQLAAKHHIYLSAGSMPELDAEGRVYNTAYVFNRDGRQIAKHRKMHLFDINVSGGQSFKESDTLAAGNRVVVFDTEFCRMGLCVCYDFRFPELPRLMSQAGANVILVPAAFNMTTGPAHWEIMFRQRAVENQVYAIGTAPARDENGVYVSWGHSIAVSPWGNILYQMDEKEGMAITELDMEEVSRVRAELPLMQRRRTDVYQLEEVRG